MTLDLVDRCKSFVLICSISIILFVIRPELLAFAVLAVAQSEHHTNFKNLKVGTQITEAAYQKQLPNSDAKQHATTIQYNELLEIFGHQLASVGEIHLHPRNVLNEGRPTLAQLSLTFYSTCVL